MSDILFQPLGSPTPAGASLDHLADIDPRLTRTHYFDGRLLTAEDLTRDQIYLDQRLRELGRILGSGVMAGLALSFDRFTGLLTLQPGQGLTALGRVLELGTPLTVNLGDRALIATLNDGKYRSLNRALYAVVLRHVDVATDMAEVFPRDLGAQRGSQYAIITESLQLGLVPLPLPLPQQSPLQIRARLMRELLGNSQYSSLIPEDSVALGVLAIQNDTPQWLDAELLRQPVRTEPGIGDLQQDLARQYENLLTDVLADRASRSLTGDFHASDYFSLLPPVGTLPKDAIDPANGRQGFFPEHYQVHIAPIRQSDVELIRAESLGLPPLDLGNGEPVDILVLAPLSNRDYGHWAAQLEREFDTSTRLLPQPDLLRLKLYPRHVIDDDKTTWTQIWNRIGPTQAFYVRRPTRAAETGISAIVLALGTSLPPAPPPVTEETGSGGGTGGGGSLPGPGTGDAPVIDSPSFSPADGGGLVQDENTVFLNQMNLKTLAELRPASAGTSSDALEKLLDKYGNDAAIVRDAAAILIRIERQYDSLIWPTLLTLADKGTLSDFRKGLLEIEESVNTAKWIAHIGADVGLDTTLLSQWADLA